MTPEDEQRHDPKAAPTWKKTFGFHPMTAWAGHGAAGAGEPLAIMLRPENAGSNTAADHIEATRLALEQLPRHLRRRVVVRADSGGGTHEFLNWLTARSRRLRYPVVMTITKDIQTAIGKIPGDAWTPTYDGDGEVRDGSPTSTGTGSPSSPPTRSAASWRTWSCGTADGRGARTGSGAPRTPGCGTCH
jgi:hypothetical protein